MKTIEIVKAALAEDSFDQDLSSQLLYRHSPKLSESVTSFKLIAKESGIYAGSEWLNAFADLDFLNISKAPSDGDMIKKGTEIISGTAKLSDIFSVERTLLNGLQNFCAIATLSNKYVSLVQKKSFELGIKAPLVLHTRKTLPLLRDLQIAAVLAGGASKHRTSLSDRIMLKDNHKELIQDTGVSYGEFLKQNLTQAEKSSGLFEVDTLQEALELKTAGISNILLDNFSPAEVKKAIAQLGSSICIEVSGGVNLETIQSYVIKGVNRISVGALTHSVKAFDISLDWSLDGKPN